MHIGVPPTPLFSQFVECIEILNEENVTKLPEKFELIWNQTQARRLHQAGRSTNFIKMTETNSLENLKPSLHDWEVDPMLWPQVQADRPLLELPSPLVGQISSCFV